MLQALDASPLPTVLGAVPTRMASAPLLLLYSFPPTLHKGNRLTFSVNAYAGTFIDHWHRKNVYHLLTMLAAGARIELKYRYSDVETPVGLARAFEQGVS